MHIVIPLSKSAILVMFFNFIRGCQCFFFPRENQKCAWNVFLAFFWVFSRTKNRFHAHYFATFHGQSKFSRAHFRIFSRMDFYFHVKKIDIFENFHVWVSFFHALKKGPEFQTIERKFQTRTIFWILRAKVAISVRYLKSKFKGFFTYSPCNFHVRDI